MAYNFRNLIFEGGGVKGIAYVGALEVMEDRGGLEEITRVGGVSAGAIFSTLAALGYTSFEMKKIVLDLDFTRFLDEDEEMLHEIRGLGRLVKKYGWFSGDFFQKWIEKLIRHKLGHGRATFRELERAPGMRSLYVCTTNMNTGYGEVLSAENTPDLAIADAVRSSMSIPLFFASTVNERRDVIVDGGVINNYPLKLFDRLKYIEDTECGLSGVETDYYIKENQAFLKANPKASPYIYNKQTLGFHLDTPEPMGVYRDQRQHRHTEIKSFLDYSRVLIRMLMNQMGNKHLHNDDWARSVYIDTLGIFTTEFGLSTEQKAALIESGRKGMATYLDWFDNSESSPRNCPERGIT
jgi:NTE family protein